jgi:short-subunit dehydrogenase
MVGAAIEQFGRIDILVNNAGVGAFGPIDDLTPQTVRQIIGTNLLGSIWCTQAALPYMRQQGKGQIIDISSILGRVSLPGRELYCASKSGQHAFSDSLRHSVTRDGIDVITIDPGPVATSFHANRLDDGAAIGGILEVSAQTVAETIIRASYLRKRKAILVGIGAVGLNAIYGVSPKVAVWLTRRADARNSKHREV